MSIVWSEFPQQTLEPICYREQFITSLINDIQDHGDGKIYSIISLNEIFNTSHIGGNHLKKKYQKNA